MSILLLQVGVPVLVSVVSAFLAVHLALRRFYQEKWWERKLTAYLAVIDALHDLKSTAAEREDAWITDQNITSEQNKELNARNRAAEAALQKTMNMGEFFVAPEAVSTVKAFVKAEYATRFAQGDPAETYSEVCALADDALKSIKTIAKMDLNPAGRPWRVSVITGVLDSWRQRKVR